MRTEFGRTLQAGQKGDEAGAVPINRAQWQLTTVAARVHRETSRDQGDLDSPAGPPVCKGRTAMRRAPSRYAGCCVRLLCNQTYGHLTYGKVTAHDSAYMACRSARTLECA